MNNALYWKPEVKEWYTGSSKFNLKYSRDQLIAALSTITIVDEIIGSIGIACIFKQCIHYRSLYKSTSSVVLLGKAKLSSK